MYFITDRSEANPLRLTHIPTQQGAYELQYYVLTIYKPIKQENINNFLARPDNKQWAVEAHESTKNKFTDQETQVGIAGPYTAETVRRHSQTSPTVEPPRQAR